MEAGARGPLVELHGALAFLESPEEGGHRADVERHGADVHQMVGDARNLAVEDADVLRALRDFEPEQSLHGERIGVLLVHRRDIVEPVEVGHRPAGRFCIRSASRCRGAAGQCAGPRARPPRRPSPAPGAARHAPPDAAARNSGSCCGSGARSRLAPVFVGFRLRLLIARQWVGHAFPGAQEVEAAKFLGELHRLVHDPLLLAVVAKLDITGQREILAQRMAVEPVVR